MPSTQNKQLQKYLSIPLKANGFRKAGATWRKSCADAICVVNLQGSQWGSNDFYVNLGVYFTALGNNASPTEYRCHVRARLDSLVPDPRGLDRMLDLREPIPDDERGAQLSRLIEGYALPWLDQFATIKGARSQLVGAQLGRRAVVTGAALRFLESA